MITETKRDLRADLMICNAATPGPWERMNTADVFTTLGATNVEGVTSDANDGWQIADCSVGITYVNKEEKQLSVGESSANATFIVEAREGWPEAIRRALAAEAEVERLTRFIESESECAIETAQEREVLVRTLSDIISAIDRGDLHKTKMSNGLDDVIHRAREALRK